MIFFLVFSKIFYCLFVSNLYWTITGKDTHLTLNLLRILFSLCFKLDSLKSELMTKNEPMIFERFFFIFFSLLFRMNLNKMFRFPFCVETKSLPSYFI